MLDPNCIQMEITCRTPRYAAILAEEGRQAEHELAEWTARTRARKEARSARQRSISVERVAQGDPGGYCARIAPTTCLASLSRSAGEALLGSRLLVVPRHSSVFEAGSMTSISSEPSL